VKQFVKLASHAVQPANSFTCRASRQGSRRGAGRLSLLAGELLHLPGKPAGVEHEVPGS
jgi:hypothetical protein